MPAKKRTSSAARPPKPSSARLDEMIGEATVDCYNESEQITGIFTMLEENLDLPFTTTVLGMEVMVDRVELTDSGTMVAVCRRQGRRQRIPLLDLPLPNPRPAGADWIDAYRRWAVRK
jgi:hypothetical protein